MWEATLPPTLQLARTRLGRWRLQRPPVERPAAVEPPLHVEIVKPPGDSSGFIVLPRRWVVQRTFSWFGRNLHPVRRQADLAVIRLLTQALTCSPAAGCG